jgi:flagellar hook-length control protein FliK
MAVAPDLLLSSVSEVRPKAAPKSSPAPADPAPGKSSSFARVLADERKAEAASSRRAEHRAHAEKQQIEQNRQKSGETDSLDEQVIAEDGKPLPAADAAEPPLDPLLLLGFEVEAGVEESAEVTIDILGGLSLNPAAGLASEADAEVPDAEAITSLGADQKAGAQAPAPSALSSSAITAEAGRKQLDIEPEPQPEPDLEAFSAKLMEQLPDAGSEPASEANFDVRLNTLAQAVNQAVPGQRPLALAPPVTMNQSGWSEAIVDRVMLLSSQNLKSAEIQLDPAELGRLDVRVSLTPEQTLVTFASPHAGVREALEAQAYRMREMFAQQGMGQVDVNVSDQSLARNFQGQQDDKERSGGRAGARSVGENEAWGAEETTVAPLAKRGLVDFYA